MATLVRARAGHIELIIGPMYSGKSTAALGRVRRYTAAKLRCVILRYANDNRYSDTKFSTHDQVMAEAVSVRSLNDLPDEFFADIDVICVDEGQFQHPLVEFCDRHASQGRIVVVSALDSDAERRPFGEVCDLVPKAEFVTKLSAVCMVCHVADASSTKRLVASEAIELIGGADLYEARCRGCWDAPVERPTPVSPAPACSTGDPHGSHLEHGQASDTGDSSTSTGTTSDADESATGDMFADISDEGDAASSH